MADDINPCIGISGRCRIPISIDNGLPSGAQILGRRFREDTILDAAEIIEAQTDTMTPIDPLFN